MNFSDLFNEALRQQQSDWNASNKTYEELLHDLKLDFKDSTQFKQRQQQGQTYNQNPRFSSLEDLNEALARQRRATQAAKAPPQPVDKQSRIKEIERELDIVRGRVPTPKGYRINPVRVKKLMQEWKQLNAT